MESLRIYEIDVKMRRQKFFSPFQFLLNRVLFKTTSGESEGIGSIGFRKHICRTLDELQTDLDEL
ncbi:MAG: hypothetical protein WC959_08840 [Kiritimatiellales bacterium]